MSTTPFPRKKLSCITFVESKHNDVMFFMKRLENNIAEMNKPSFNLLIIENILNQLSVLVSEVKTKCSIYFNLEASKMLTTYDGCTEHTAHILEQAMTDINSCNSQLEIGIQASNLYLLKNGATAELLDNIIKNCNRLLNTLNESNNTLAKITHLNYAKYEIQENAYKPEIHFRSLLWGGRRSKSWRRKTIRWRNKKTKRRRNKSTRLY